MVTLYPIDTNIPSTPNDPADDQPVMQQNFANIAGYVAVDHVPAGSVNNGYHTIIHEASQGTWLPATSAGAPAATTGINQIFSLLYTPDCTNATTDTQLFSQTGGSIAGNGVSQLTGNQSATEGYVWAGGLLLQWGFVANTGSGSGIVTFKDRDGALKCIPFPRTLFFVSATPTFTTTLPSATTNCTISIDTNPANTSKTQFKYNKSLSAGAGTSYVGFSWFAIGN